jgi:hypothetical protein
MTRPGVVELKGLSDVSTSDLLGQWYGMVALLVLFHLLLLGLFLLFVGAQKRPTAAQRVRLKQAYDKAS